MSKRDYYETLQVSKQADDAELKSAFRKMAKKYHPDRNQGDDESEKRFKEVGEAYEVLKDPQKRAAYDQYGHAAFEGGGGGPGRARFWSRFRGLHVGYFRRSVRLWRRSWRGASGGAGGRQRGDDLRYNMEITLEEAFKGKNAEISVPTAGLRDLQRLRGQKRHQADLVPHLPGIWQSARGAGIFHH